MFLIEICFPHIYFSNGLSCMPNMDRMPKLWPQEVDVPANPNMAHKIFPPHLLGLVFWMFMFLPFFLMIKKLDSLIVT